MGMVNTISKPSTDEMTSRHVLKGYVFASTETNGQAAIRRDYDAEIIRAIRVKRYLISEGDFDPLALAQLDEIICAAKNASSPVRSQEVIQLLIAWYRENGNFP